MEFFMPLLMVKDFNSTGFTVSEEFMTNADVPVIATEGLIENPLNPFTGNPINSQFKNGPQTVFLLNDCEPSASSGSTFDPGAWFIFEGGDPHNAENWTYVGEH